MRTRGTQLLWISVLLCLCVPTGCKRDPQAQRKRFADRASSYFQQGKYREAAIEYENALQIDPKFADAHYGLAQCLLKLSNLRGGYQELMAAVEIDPSNAKAQVDLGNLLLAGHNADEARKHAEIVLHDNPQNPEAEMLLSGTDAAKGDLPTALHEAQQAIEMDTNRAASYIYLAVLQEQSEDATSAEQNFQKAISLDPKSESARLTYGAFCERQKNTSEAEKQFQAAIAIAPQDPAARGSLAKLYLSEGQKDMAEQVLHDAKTALKDNPAGYGILGDYYLSQGESDKAAAEFASLHAEHPHDASLARTYIELLIVQNHLDEATKLNDALLKNSPNDIDSLVLRGDILTREGKVSDAVPILEGAVKVAPDNPMAHYHLGLGYAGVENLGQAQAEWAEAARLRPNMIEPERALATVAARTGNYVLLTDSSQQLIRIEPKSPEGYVFHARALFAKGDAAGAEADLNKAIVVAPQDANAYARMGDLRMAQKRLDEAAKFYSQALALNPSASDALVGLIDIDLERKQPEQALRRVQDQITRVPNSSALYLLLGQAELRNQDPTKAEAAFEKAIDLDKNNVMAFLLLASSEVARGSVDQAIANYQRALQDNPRDLRTYIFLASLLETKGDWQQAEDLYQKALQIQPDYAVAANNLAYLMLEHDGNINVALALAQTARKGLPDVPSAADTLGWAYYHQGAYSSAIDTLQEAVNANPKNPNFHYHLGMAYEKANNPAMAKKQLEYTLKISPNYAQADEIRKVLSESPSQN
jgi:tetratricopeptide (TPR) repeat protein